MYIVEADLTPFHDRWGEEHYRLIYKSKYKWVAWFKAWIHCRRHPYGSASVIIVRNIIEKLEKNRRPENMELIVDEERKNAIENLMDPTSLKTMFHYMENELEGISFIALVQEGYDLPSVASPFIVSNKDNKVSEKLPAEKQVEYLQELLKEGVLRIVVPQGTKRNCQTELFQYTDEPSDYDENSAYLVAMVPPIYWGISMSKKWE